MVGEIRSISVSSPVTFSDVSAIMSDKSTGEDGNELSEMQRVTLMFHMLEHMVFPAAIFTREIKSSTIAFAKETMGIHVSVSLLERLLKSYKDQRREKTAVYEFKSKKLGNVGRNTKLTPSLRSQYTLIIEKYAYSFRTLTAETCFDELKKLQVDICLRTVYNHLHDMNAYWHRLYLKLISNVSRQPLVAQR